MVTVKLTGFQIAFVLEARCAPVLVVLSPGLSSICLCARFDLLYLQHVIELSSNPPSPLPHSVDEMLMWLVALGVMMPSLPYVLRC